LRGGDSPAVYGVSPAAGAAHPEAGRPKAPPRDVAARVTWPSSWLPGLS